MYFAHKTLLCKPKNKLWYVVLTTLHLAIIQ